MRFSRRLILAASLMVAAAAILSAALIYFPTEAALRSSILRQLELVAFQKMGSLDRFFSERYGDMRVLAEDAVISDPTSTPEAITERLAAFRNQKRTYVSLSFFTPDRIRVADTSGIAVGLPHPQPAIWSEIAQPQLAGASSVFQSVTLQIPVVFFTAPVRDRSGRIFGHVVARVPVSRIYELTKPNGDEPADVEIELVDSRGLLLYSNVDKAGMLRDDLSGAAFFQDATRGQPEGHLLEIDPGTGAREIVVYSRQRGYLDFPGNGWVLVVRSPYATTFSPILLLRREALLILVCLPLALVPGVLYLRALSRPLDALRDAAASIGKGHLGTRVPVTSDDEIGLLARSLNEMAAGLQEITASRDELNQEISERRQREAEIERLNNELRENLARLKFVNDELESFTYTASHDLRAPLATIDGFATLLQEQYGAALDDQGRTWLKFIGEQAAHLQRLIQDLLTFSRLGQQDLAWSAVDVGAMIREIATEVRASEPNRRIDIRIGDLPLAHGDRAMLRQVFANLLYNAAKFTRPRETAVIEVAAVAGPDEVVYHVKDNGVGFDPRYAKSLFGVFKRLHTQQEFEGTGAGLAIVSRIVQRHGGRVWAEAVLGEGATFRVALPHVQPESGGGASQG